MSSHPLKNFRQLAEGSTQEFLSGILSGVTSNHENCRNKFFSPTTAGQCRLMNENRSIMEIGSSKYIHKTCNPVNVINEIEDKQKEDVKNMELEVTQLINKYCLLVPDHQIFNIFEKTVFHTLNYESTSGFKTKYQKCPKCLKRVVSSRIDSHGCKDCTFQFSSKKGCKLTHDESKVFRGLHLKCDDRFFIEDQGKPVMDNIKKCFDREEIKKIFDQIGQEQNFVIVTIHQLKKYRSQIIKTIEDKMDASCGFLSYQCHCGSPTGGKQASKQAATRQIVPGDGHGETTAAPKHLQQLPNSSTSVVRSEVKKKLNRCHCNRNMIKNLIGQFHSHLPGGSDGTELSKELRSLKTENKSSIVGVVSIFNRDVIVEKPNLIFDLYFILIDRLDYCYFKEHNRSVVKSADKFKIKDEDE